MSPRLLILAVALAAPLAGCVSLLPKPPPAPRIYTMEAAPASAMTVAPKPVVIAVSQPSPPRALGGADIVWARNGAVAYIEGAQWAGRGPDLLQTLLVHTIDRSGAARGAVRAGEGRADSEITWDLSAFGVVEDGAPEARIAAQAKLFGARDRLLISALEVDERVKLKDRSSAAAAAALEEAAQHAAAKLTAWAVANTPPPKEPAAP